MKRPHVLFICFLIFGTSVQAADVFQTDTLYRKSLAKIMKTYKDRTKIEYPDFQMNSWLDKIAMINFFCSLRSGDMCRRVVFWGVRDSSLMVRDHAFSVMKNSLHFSKEEVYSVAVSAREDTRNFRNGEPLWLIQKTDRYIREFERAR